MESKGRTSDLLIVGGGVIGLSIARELKRSGVKRITIVDHGRIGGEASAAAAGMLAPNAECDAVDDLYRLCDASRALYPDWAAALLEETGVDIELDRSGTLFTAFSLEDSEHLAARFERQEAAGIPVEHWSAAETLQAEPSIAEDVRESLFFPNDWQVENRKLIEALKAFVRINDIDLVAGARVESLIVENGRVAGVNADSGQIFAGTTILSAGAWTSLIGPVGSALNLQVKPMRGQMISFHPAKRLLRRVVYSPRGYLVPRADGRLLAGATVEDAGFEVKVTNEAAESLRSAAAEILPNLEANDVIEHWAGLRPFSAGGRPLIGPVRGIEGLFVATGHFRNGILLAPITARIIAEYVAGGALSREAEAFLPGPVISAAAEF